MGDPLRRPRTAEEWKAFGRARAQAKAQRRRERGGGLEIVPVVTVPVGCLPLLLAWPLLAVLWVLRTQSTTTDPGANPQTDAGDGRGA
jgi:hypothetical protein